MKARQVTDGDYNNLKVFGYNWKTKMEWGIVDPRKSYKHFNKSKVDNSNGLSLGVEYNQTIINAYNYKGRSPFRLGLVSSQERFTYGYYRFVFKLPHGICNWPAIWLYCPENEWTPEIDIMEGDSGRFGGYIKPRLKDFWKIHPITTNLHYSHKGDESKHLGAKRGQLFTLLDLNLHHPITAEMIWTPNGISIWYNKRLVRKITDPVILNYTNRNNKLQLVMNNSVTDEIKHYDGIRANSEFQILDFTYEEY